MIRDPYAAAIVALARWSTTFSNNGRLWVWVPAFAGTTGSHTGSAMEYLTWLSAKLDSIEAMPSSRVNSGGGCFVTSCVGNDPKSRMLGTLRWIVRESGRSSTPRASD